MHVVPHAGVSHFLVVELHDVHPLNELEQDKSFVQPVPHAGGVSHFLLVGLHAVHPVNEPEQV